MDFANKMAAGVSERFLRYEQESGVFGVANYISSCRFIKFKIPVFKIPELPHCTTSIKRKDNKGDRKGRIGFCGIT